MQLRTVKKTKNKNKDLGYNLNPSQNTKKAMNKKENTTEKDNHSCNDNSNDSNENEAKKRHQLRKSSTNYQGKYKKMNSGKYLYKAPVPDKRPPSTIKKKQLKYIPNEFSNQFKKFLMHLYKKEEETLLNRKKKREESKLKPKTDKIIRRTNNNPITSKQNINSYNGMRQSYDLHSRNMNLIEGGGIQSHIGGGQSVFMINHDGMNNQGMYHYNPTDYVKKFNESHIENALKKGVLNHITGAYFINYSQKSKARSNHNLTKKIVPVSTVSLNDSPIKNEGSNDYSLMKDNLQDKSSLAKYFGAQPMINSQQQQEQQQQQQQNSLLNQNTNLQSQQNSNVGNKNVLKDNEQSKNTILYKPINEMNSLIKNQLNEVSNVIKNIKEDKIDELFAKK